MSKKVFIDTMKHSIIGIVLLIISIAGFGQVAVAEQEEWVYRTYPLYEESYTELVDIKIATYVTKSLNDDTLQYKNVKYLYRLYGISKSTTEGLLTPTWIRGLDILLDGKAIRKYPHGMTILVGNEPTELFRLYANKENIDLRCKWDSAYYVPTPPNRKKNEDN
jgi:hypothetical protein